MHHDRLMAHGSAPVGHCILCTTCILLYVCLQTTLCLWIVLSFQRLNSFLTSCNYLTTWLCCLRTHTVSADWSEQHHMKSPNPSLPASGTLWGAAALELTPPHTQVHLWLTPPAHTCSMPVINRSSNDDSRAAIGKEGLNRH